MAWRSTGSDKGKSGFMADAVSDVANLPTTGINPESYCLVEATKAVYLFNGTAWFVWS
jgi:hypothetical protein